MCLGAAVVGTGWGWDLGVCTCVTIALFHCRVLCKFAFSLSQDWELPIKREVSRWHLSFSLSHGLRLLPPSPSFVLQPILCLLLSRRRRLWMGPLSLPGQAVPGSCGAALAEGAACPCPAGAEGNGRPLPSPLLSKPQGLSLFRLHGGGKCRRLLCLGAGDPGTLGRCPQTQPPLLRVRCADPALAVIPQEKEKKPLKEGVQDMLVKHHLFSWDIDG